MIVCRNITKHVKSYSSTYHTLTEFSWTIQNSILLTVMCKEKLYAFLKYDIFQSLWRVKILQFYVFLLYLVSPQLFLHYVIIAKHYSIRYILGGKSASQEAPVGNRPPVFVENSMDCHNIQMAID